MGSLKFCLNSVIAIFFIIFCIVDLCRGEDPSVSIDLIKIEDEIHPVADKTETNGDETNVIRIDGFDVQTSKIIVAQGDSILKLLHETGVMKPNNLDRLLTITRKLNPSLKNIDLIHPRNVIILPLKISPAHIQTSSVQETISQDHDVTFDFYTVKKGDTVSAIIHKYNENLSFKEYKEYLAVFSKLNPEIKNSDIIFQNQKIRLPIFSKTAVRRPIEKPPAEKKTPLKNSTSTPISLEEKIHTLQLLFIAMGEEWINSGEHFIPFPSGGGHINLDAVSFPVLNIRTGKKIIFDINNKLGDDICKLIEGNWNQYKVFKMKDWTFDTSFDELIKFCSYPTVRTRHQPFVIDSNPEISLEGDWIVTMGASNDAKLRPSMVVISKYSNELDISNTLRRALLEIGIAVIEIENLKNPYSFSDTVLSGGDNDIYIKSGPAQLIETLLGLNGIAFTRDNSISVYQDNSDGLNLMVLADFMITRGDKEYIIDLNGLSKEMISFLKNHKFNILSVAGYEDKPEKIAERIFSFVDIAYKSQPLSLYSGGDKGVKITININGIRFVSANGDSFLVLPSAFSDSIMSFLHEEGLSLIIPEYQ